MPQYLIRGLKLEDGRERRSPLLDDDEFELELSAAIELTDATRDAEASDIDIGDDAKPAIVELEFDDEIRMWVRPSELQELESLTVEKTESGTLRFAAAPDTTRGGRRLALKFLRLFRPKKKVSALARQELIRHIESKAGREPGLYRLRGDREPLFEAFNADAAGQTGDEPWLVLIHGTASTTTGSFGSLWDSASTARSSFAELRGRYGPDNILALEHRTLSVDPISNALQMVEALPAGSRLHLLSHSRGGLVAELLARRADGVAYYSDVDFAAFEEACGGDPEPVKRLRELDQALRDKRISVDRMVRVACPARGTTLASERLERWLNISLNVAQWTIKHGSKAVAPALAPTIHMGSSLLKGLLLDLADLDHIPGLKAMDPQSPFIRGLINSETARSDSELIVIAGQSEGNGFFQRLLVVFANVFFSNRNDLVVDTPAMYGGAHRPSSRALRYQFSSPEINHFRYFSNPATAGRIVASLRADQIEALNLESFPVDQSALRAAPLTSAPTRSSNPKPPISIVLPGIMGSHLEVRDDKVWVHYFRLLRGQFTKLAIDAAHVEPVGIDGDTYTPLVDFLAQTHRVVLFPYDWRLSIEDAGRRLNERLHALLEEINPKQQPIRLVAHSMGGLVARAMMLQPDSAWPKIRENEGSRLLMMGTPNAGSHAISLLLAGENRLLRMLALLDIRNSRSDLVRIASGFSGALDMIPWPSDRDYFTDGVLDKVLDPLGKDWPRPSKSEIERAFAWRKMLSEQKLDSDSVFYIAGHGRKGTPVGISIDKGARRPLTFAMTARGDGTVPWEGGIPKGIKCWYVDAAHGDIPKHSRSHAAYLEILEKGDTVRLESNPPVVRSQMASLKPGDLEPTFLPSADDLSRAAMGSTDEYDFSDISSPPPTINVRMVWGDLAWSRSPIVVGHYAGDTIVSAEAALDRRLGGELSKRHAMGVYPQKIGTSLVVSGSKHHHGAIVIGLGMIGSLTRGDLSATVRQGVLEWAADALSGLAPEDSKDSSLAFVMVGTGSAGLPMRDAARSILIGIDDALKRLGPEDAARLGLLTLDFIELYEDRAHTFWHELGLLLNGDSADPSLSRFSLDSQGIRAAKNGRRRLIISEGNNWWSPLRITMNDDVMVFESIGDRARAEQRGVSTELAQIEHLINQAISNGRRDSDIEIALFEMLIPNDLKEAAQKLENTRLLVDKQSAWIPWELLADRDSARNGGHCGNGEPPVPQSVQTGMVRQFVSDGIAPRLRATEGRCALVIGDPDTTAPNEESIGALAGLPGARSEARKVHQMFDESGFHSRALIAGGSEGAIKALFRCGYRIIHLAGHGVLDSAKYMEEGLDALPAANATTQTDSVSGFVIGFRQTLSHKHISQLREVPELVFINCCHLGAVRPGTTRLAADFGERFIHQGVRAVVAAGWAVEDNAALNFAETFYNHLFSGRSFGDAVKAARQSTYEAYPNSNTWAAYQCYGDPSYRLTNFDKQQRSTDHSFNFASARHLITEGIEQTGSVDELVRLQNHLDSNWKQSNRWPSPELLYALAERYRQLGDLPRARDGFKAAMDTGDSHLPARAVEQWANLHARLAATDQGIPQKDRRAAIRDARNAIKRLDPEISTSERQAIMASTYKREAMIVGGKSRIKALESAAEYYERAGRWDEAKKKNNASAGDSYGLLQAATMNAALAWLDSNLSKKRLALRQIKVCEEISSKFEITDDFWIRAMKADLNIARSFATGDLSREMAAEIAGQYNDAAEVARDFGQIASVIDNVSGMKRILTGVKSEKSELLTASYSDVLRHLMGG